MSLSIPRPSRRFLNAAANERDEVVAHRAKAFVERDRLLSELARVDRAIAELGDRLQGLEQLLQSEGVAVPAQSRQVPHTSLAANPADPGMAKRIKGPEIREVAVQVLLSQPLYIEAIHYGAWYDMVITAGYEITGKNPKAVFLTQITRSPVVKKAVEPGIYEIDRQVPLRLRQRLDRLNAELRDLSGTTSDPDADEARRRRRELTVQISRAERELDEALHVLRRISSEPDEMPSRASRPEPPENQVRRFAGA